MAGVEVTGDDHGQSRRKSFQKTGHHTGASGLDRRVKIKMGVGCQQMPALFLPHTAGATGTRAFWTECRETGR